MPSPFPGMNPYLEQESVWHDFHERFITASADALAAQVDPDYVVRIDERVYIHELPASTDPFLGRADIAVNSAPAATHIRERSSALQAPAQVSLPRVDVERLGFVEIRGRESWQVVTVLELISPANKYAGPDREQYLAKRAQLLNSATHFIELDLRRGGPRLPLEGLAECDYYALVSRYEDRPQAGVWPIRLSDRLPVIPVPLHGSDPDAQLDLQAVLHRVYDAARYQTYIYRGQPQPSLSPEAAAWALQFVPPQPAAG